MSSPAPDLHPVGTFARRYKITLLYIAFAVTAILVLTIYQAVTDHPIVACGDVDLAAATVAILRA